MARPFKIAPQYTEKNPPPGKIFTGYKTEEFVQRGLSPKSSNFGRTQTRQVPVFIDDPALRIAAPTPAPAAPAPTPAPTFTPTPLTPTTPAPTITEPSQQNVDLVAEFKKQIEDLKASNQEALQSQASLFTEQAKKQEERLLNLQGQLGQQQERFSSELGQQQERFTNQYNQLAMASAAPRQQLGVRTATGSAGTGMQIAGRGISGAFGRKGMRISSLNLG